MSEGAPRSALAHRVVVAVTGALLVVGAVVAFAVRGGPGAAARPAVSDVPRADGRAIVFSGAFRERAGVKTVTARRTQITPVVKVVGTVTFDPEHVAAVGTRIRGVVKRLRRFEGDTVKAGEVLAEIDSAELGQAQASVTMIEAQRRAAELNATRERDLAGRQLSTAREAEVAIAHLDEHRAMLVAARQKVAALGGEGGGAFGVHLLRAPIAGTVVERHLSAGQSVEDNLVAYRVAHLDWLWIELAVFEKSLGGIRRDDLVEIRLADQEQALEGRVAYVGDEIDRDTRSASVRVKVDNRGRALRPGQSVAARIHASGPARAALSVPSGAVTYVDGKPTVFVAEGDHRVTPTEVVLGATDGREQEILSGLVEGASVVSEGVFALKSELYR